MICQINLQNFPLKFKNKYFCISLTLKKFADFHSRKSFCKDEFCFCDCCLVSATGPSFLNLMFSEVVFFSQKIKIIHNNRTLGKKTRTDPWFYICSVPLFLTCISFTVTHLKYRFIAGLLQ